MSYVNLDDDAKIFALKELARKQNPLTNWIKE